MIYNIEYQATQYNTKSRNARGMMMSNEESSIRKMARNGRIRYTTHALKRMKEYGLNVLQVNEMLKNCSHNQHLGDVNGNRFEGHAPEQDVTGTRRISAHARIVSDEYWLIITIINN